MHRQRVALSLWPVVIAVALSCKGQDRAAVDSTSDTSRVATTPEHPAEWVGELGSLLVVPSDSENTAIVLFPSAPSPRQISTAQLTLLSAAGDTTRAPASLVVSDSQVCGEAPTIRFRGVVSAPWAVGLQSRSVVPFHMDSIEGLPPADSAHFAVELARVASTLPNEKGSRFSGSPFVVLSARRFEALGRRIVVAHLVRRLPLEASPLEEHTLVVAEHADSSARDGFTVSYHQRSEGTEETVDHYEVLAAVRSADNVFLLLSRERDEQTVYEILERAKTGWRLRWARTLAC